MEAIWKALGKVALATALFYALNLFVSIPIAVVAAVMAFASNSGEAVTEESLLLLLQSSPPLKAASFTLSAAAAVAAALIMYKAFERDRSWSLGWRQPRRFAMSVGGLSLGAMLISAAFALAIGFGGLRIVGASWTSEIATALLFDALLFTAVGIGEEVFSRGYVYGVMKRAGGITLAIAVSSLLFALIHSGNPAVFDSVFPMLNLTLAGVMFALMREWSGGLWVPIGAHISWNFVQGNVLGIAVSGVPTPSILQVETLDAFASGGAFGLEGSFATTAVLVGVSALLWFGIQQKNNRKGSSVS
ncbi:CPBP family intramembrane metalloprotease [Paenibacillus sp. TRM 82003]|nr:CPBP family intramembrane metalloprotease [Paenibacillus sp. TRM 82003]